MTILQLTSHLEIGGITRYVLSLSRRLIARGHHVIIAADGGSCVPDVAAMGARHWPLPLHTSIEFSPRVWLAGRQLLAQLRREPVDVIHAHTRVAQVIAERLSRTLGIPYVATWHGIYRRRLGRRLWPCTGAVTIAISEPVRQHVLEIFRVPDQRVRCIYNGIDPDHYAAAPDAAVVAAFRTRWRITETDPVIGHIGRLAGGGVKGFDLLLAATQRLAAAFPRLQVVIVGDGPRRAFLERETRRLGISERVRFVGALDDVRIALAVMDVFIFASRWPEGFGLTLVEAMAAGKPVVAARMGAIPDIIQHGVYGWLVPPEDPAAIADAAARLLQDRTSAGQMGRQAQQRVRERFSLERMTTEIEAVYREVVRR